MTIAVWRIQWRTPLDRSSGRFERKPSFRRKIGSLIRSSAELPAVINRGLQPIRRSLSFSKDLNRLHEPSKPSKAGSAQWYNSLVSLVEDECLDELDATPPRNSASEELLSPKVQVTRTQSFSDTTSVRFTLMIDHLIIHRGFESTQLSG